MAERIAHKGCDFLVANPAMAAALGPVAPHVATACGLLKTYRKAVPGAKRLKKKRKRK